MTEIQEIIDEAIELIERYRPDEEIPVTWERNLRLLATLLTLHKVWISRAGSCPPTGVVIDEMDKLLRVAFEMGRTAG